MAGRIVSHWTDGAGAVYNPKRRAALEMIRVRKSLAAVIEEITAEGGHTASRGHQRQKSCREHQLWHGLRHQLADGTPHLLLLGTAWGLAEEALEAADYRLAPIRRQAETTITCRCGRRRPSSSTG